MGNAWTISGSDLYDYANNVEGFYVEMTGLQRRGADRKRFKKLAQEVADHYLEKNPQHALEKNAVDDCVEEMIDN